MYIYHKNHVPNPSTFSELVRSLSLLSSQAHHNVPGQFIFGANLNTNDRRSLSFYYVVNDDRIICLITLYFVLNASNNKHLSNTV